MITRMLAKEEWPKLDATDAADVWRHLDPHWAEVLVVEKAGRIVGACILMTILHPECFWIDKGHRGSGIVAKHLWWAIQAKAKAYHMKTVAAAATTDDMRDLLLHLGAQPLPGEHFVLSVKESI